jgi:4'-phosphopantetheinyl transferase
MAHAGLRLVLGGLLDIEASAIEFDEDGNGKPRLAGTGPPPLFFNLSHSHDLTAVAVSASFEVGLDIEMLRPADLSGVTSFFSTREQAVLLGLPHAIRTACTFAAWTRKEAFVKATGLGLAMPLDSFEVSLDPNEPARLLRVAGASEEAASWQLAHLVPARGYVGTVAARSRGWQVVLNELALDLQPLGG